jgi:D-alanyl-D-alanine dipeptidase
MTFDETLKTIYKARLWEVSGENVRLRAVLQRTMANGGLMLEEDREWWEARMAEKKEGLQFFYK